MKFQLRRTVSCPPVTTVEGVSIGGTHLFTIFRQGPADKCVPLSAFGAIYHRRPAWNATRTSGATVATFEDFERAYATRCDNNVFNAAILAQYQLREHWGPQTPILDPKHACRPPNPGLRVPVSVDSAQEALEKYTEIFFCFFR